MMRDHKLVEGILNDDEGGREGYLSMQGRSDGSNLWWPKSDIMVFRCGWCVYRVWKEPRRCWAGNHGIYNMDHNVLPELQRGH